jgi:aspartyl-tRNA(Asn)/glutamyl-tRNA(Gln) amidotransferase subunit C
MELGPEDVAYIAHLARLQIDEQDVPLYARNLSEILRLVETMNAVDTDGVVPMAHPVDTAQPLRADEVTEGDRREEFQRNAPAVADGLYLVPKVIE